MSADVSGVDAAGLIVPEAADLPRIGGGPLYEAARRGGFALHNITYSSASQINTWANEPALWVLEKLLGRKQAGGARAVRGIAVEMAVVDVLKNGASFDDATRRAVEHFNKATALSGDLHRDNEREHIAPMIELALGELTPLGELDFPTGYPQHRIEITAIGDGWTLPVTGYLDFVFAKTVVDLKTSLRSPRVMSREHQRQRAIYQRAMSDRPVKFLYVSPEKSVWLEDGDVDEVLDECKALLSRQERFLRLSPDPRVLAGAVPVLPGSFYWNASWSKAARHEVFGL